jgi:very-short-patch-repair endonuclease
MNTAANRYIPYPIIMGPRQPELRLHGEIHYSLQHRNLFVPESRLDQEGTYSISAFLLERTNLRGLWPLDQPVSLSKDQEIPMCHDCLFKPCPMIVKDFSTRMVKREVDQSGRSYEPLVVSSHIDFWKTPRVDLCPAISCLLELCQTNTEKKFLTRYYELAFGGWVEIHEGIFDWAEMDYCRAGWLDEWHFRQAELPPRYRDPAHVSLSILRGLAAPVLLPQVWINYEFGTQESRDPLPSRVDFACFFRGQKHAIEIDGPSHYSHWDEVRRCYVGDEEQYTATLQRDRWLRRLGWQSHRFSNNEIDVAEIKLVQDSKLGTYTDYTLLGRLQNDIAFEIFGGDYEQYHQPHVPGLLPPNS